MNERQQHASERVSKQKVIDAKFVDTIWIKTVEVPLVEMCFAHALPQAPIILLPEMRFNSLIKTTHECFPSARLMIVDETNYRFDDIRQSFGSTEVNLYFSTQDLSTLNYSDDVFHYIITEMGPKTVNWRESVFPEYRRVLRPGGHFIFSTPLAGTFPVFFDLLDECLLRVAPQQHSKITEHLARSMETSEIENGLVKSGLIREHFEEAHLQLRFPSAEELLFSILMESHYLGFCFALSSLEVDAKALISLLVRAFHHYFQGQALDVPMRLGLYSTSKQ